MGIHSINDPLTPEEQAQQKKQAEARAAAQKESAARAYAVANAVKEGMNDPRSFELVRALVTDKGGVCLRFRGKNEFGATMTQEIAVDAANKLKQSSVVCAKGVAVRDVSYISSLL